MNISIYANISVYMILGVYMNMNTEYSRCPNWQPVATTPSFSPSAIATGARAGKPERPGRRPTRTGEREHAALTTEGVLSQWHACIFF